MVSVKETYVILLVVWMVMEVLHSNHFLGGGEGASLSEVGVKGAWLGSKQWLVG